MDELTPDDWRLLLTAMKIAYGAHNKVHREAVADALNREISPHYRRLANQDANWAAEQMACLSRLDGKLRLMRARLEEREVA